MCIAQQTSATTWKNLPVWEKIVEQYRLPLRRLHCHPARFTNFRAGDVVYLCAWNAVRLRKVGPSACFDLHGDVEKRTLIADSVKVYCLVSALDIPPTCTRTTWQACSWLRNESIA